MPLEFRCPHCGQTLTAPDGAAGQSGKCRFCNAIVQAPGAPDEAAQLIQPGAQVAPPPPSPVAGTGIDYGYAPTYQVGYPSGPIGHVSPGLIFGEAWQVASANWGILIGAVVLSYVIMYAAMLLPMVFLIPRGSEVPQITDLAWFGASVGLLMVAISPVFLGVFSIVDELLTRGQASVGTLFAPFRRYGKVLGTTLLIGIIASPLYLASMALMMPMFWMDYGPSSAEMPMPFLGEPLFILGYALLTLASIYLMIGLAWAPLEVLDRNAAPLDAIRESWGAVRGKRLAVFGTLALLWLVNFVGSFCCITVLFTTPLAMVGLVITYRQLRGLEGRIY